VALALLLGAASVSLLHAPAASAQSGVPKGTTTTYAVLAASAVASTGLGGVNGDLGVGPGTALTAFPPGVTTGATHLGDPVAAQAQAGGVKIPPTPAPTATPAPTPTPTFSCGLKVTGGGQIPVPDPDSNIELSIGTGRATFGFNSQPKKGCTDGAAKGHIDYVNHLTGLHISGKVTNSQLIAPNTVQFAGECGAGCTFTVTLQDNGEPDTPDTFGLAVTGTKNEVRSPRPISRGNLLFH
jgi:hypothetical protein